MAVLGLGLMGGSLGLALRSRVAGCRVSGYARREETRTAALRMGAVDDATGDPAEAVGGADLVVVCAPVLAIPDLIARAAPSFAADAVVTDVGSTKEWIIQHARAAMSDVGAVFVGSHPVAGSEREGIAAAREDLYQDSVCVVTRDGAPEAAADRVRSMWTAVGARILNLDAETHDRMLARTSHLPHLAAGLVAMCAGRPGVSAVDAASLCGPGLRDTTRIAEGSPDIWHDIVLTNRDAILSELDAMESDLAALATILRDGHFDRVKRWLDEARQSRRRIVSPRGDSPGGME